MASTSKTQSLDLERTLDEVIDWRYKSFPAGPPVKVRSVREKGWNALGGDFMLPLMLLKESALRHNIDEMAALCARTGFSLAPHAKTSMAPQLVQLQLAAGAWAITAATTWQARLWRELGAGRIILANELVERASIDWVAAEMQRDPEFEFYCLVDSVAAVNALDRAPGFKVLLELGFAGGRTGCRTEEQALEVAQAIKTSSHVTLAGVEAFEGIVHGESLEASLETVDALLSRIRRLASELDSGGHFAKAGEVVLSAGGSAFFDRVIAGLGGPWQLSRPVRPVLRSGCYLTHDSVHYAEVTPFGSRLAGTDPLAEAFEVWGAVLSTPEPGLALIGFGKRDVPYDLGLPAPRYIKRGREAPRKFAHAASIFNTNDQHAYLRLDAGEDLHVGDLVGCGISHPCTAFDKWRLIPLVDDSYRVVDAVMTYF
ncbi:MAG TPA: alanine racemase [Candidatus Polarisedimenticolia bacterium]|nr:alanine racemase [Candidatus Polarisedimenticolia bacterium]